MKQAQQQPRPQTHKKKRTQLRLLQVRMAGCSRDRTQGRRAKRGSSSRCKKRYLRKKRLRCILKVFRELKWQTGRKMLMHLQQGARRR